MFLHSEVLLEVLLALFVLHFHSFDDIFVLLPGDFGVVRSRIGWLDVLLFFIFYLELIFSFRDYAGKVAKFSTPFKQACCNEGCNC
jgi:hypothetical protein